MFKKLVIASALTLIASASFAQTVPGMYVGGQLSSSKFENIDDYNIDGRQTGAGLFAGYQFNDTFALEAGYARLGDEDFTYAGLPLNAKFTQASISGIATLPLSNGFNVFGRLGYNQVDVKISGPAGSSTDDVSGALYGIGLGYNFTPSIAGRVEFQKASSDSTTAVAAIVFKF